jgi:hypothetical protein
MRLAVEQIGQRLRPQRPGDEIGHAAPRIANAGRPPARIARVSLCETAAPIAPAKQKGIGTKTLRLLDSSPGKQVKRGRRRRIGNDFRHRRGSGADEGRSIYSRYVLFKAATGVPPESTGKADQPTSAPCWARRPAKITMRRVCGGFPGVPKPLESDSGQHAAARKRPAAQLRSAGASRSPP